ncbi:MAG: universal stress protein [Deltaproteobacteria bacterium]|nr:universal stress protein [Deltaproteobacteria bacterium]MBW1955881.1 universal stress protein [Deltaproteobacteria bacterium]MBW2042216.1 universal stress protein [Deltaproteobacteria bacterium]MBW2132577.1 universal stress protein [Deltaproteobacteria bacterium]
MKDFKTILFPVDLSEASIKVVPYVITMAQKFMAGIDLLHVARRFEYFETSYIPHPAMDQFEKEIAEGALMQMEAFRQTHFPEMKNVTVEVVTGHCSDEILNHVETHEVDLVIMGTHGRKGLDRMLFGSVARRVSQDCPVPVLLINPFRGS